MVSIQDNLVLKFETELPEDIAEITLPEKSQAVEKRVTFEQSSDKPKPVDIVERLKRDYGLCVVDGEYAIYDRKSNHWCYGLKSVKAVVQNYIWIHITINGLKEVVNNIELKKEMGLLPEYSPAPSNYIFFKNCIVDFKNRNSDGTFKVYEYSPSFITVAGIIPHDYNPDADSSKVLESIRDLICDGDETRFKCLCEEFGWAMAPECSTYIDVLMSTNPEGNASNGKSSWLESMIQLWGGKASPYVTKFSPQQLGGRFNTGLLEHSRVNIGDDISSEFTNSTAMSVMKELVTDGSIQTELKGQDSKTISSVTQFVFSANKLGNFKLDEGILRRLRFIDLNHIFKSSDAGFKRNFAKSFWSQEENMQSMINFGLVALYELSLREGTATETSNGLAMKDKFVGDNTLVSQWLDARGYTKALITSREFIQYDESNYGSVKEQNEIKESVFGWCMGKRDEALAAPLSVQNLYQDFSIWCKYNGSKGCGIKNFKEEVESLLHIRCDRNASKKYNQKDEKAKVSYKALMSNGKTAKFFRQIENDEPVFALEHEDAELNLQELIETYKFFSKSTIKVVMEDIQSSGANVPLEIANYAYENNVPKSVLDAGIID